MPRRNDLDGRGKLSEEALGTFTESFLKTWIDQVSFRESLMQPDRLRARILLWAEEEIKLKNLLPRSGRVLEALLYRGELPRSDVASAAGVVERHAWRVVGANGPWRNRFGKPASSVAPCFPSRLRAGRPAYFLNLT